MPDDHAHRSSHDMLRIFPRRRRYTADAAAVGSGSSSSSLPTPQDPGLSLEGSTLLSGAGVERRVAGAALRSTGAGPVSAAAPASRQKQAPSRRLSWGASLPQVAEARALPPPSAGRSGTSPCSARVSEAAGSDTSRSDSAAGEQPRAALAVGSATCAAAAAGPGQQTLEAHSSQAPSSEGLLVGSRPGRPAAVQRAEASSPAGERAEGSGSMQWGRAAEGSLSQGTPAAAAVLEAGGSADESGVSSSLDSRRTAAHVTLRVCVGCVWAVSGVRGLPACSAGMGRCGGHGRNASCSCCSRQQCSSAEQAPAQLCRTAGTCGHA